MLVGTCLPWIEVGGIAFSGLALGTVDFAAGEIPSELGLPSMSFTLAFATTLVLMFKRGAWWWRAATLMIALGAFATAVSRLRVATEVVDHAAAGLLRAGVHLTGGCLLGLLAATIVSGVREVRSSSQQRHTRSDMPKL